jgi:hypothetical protein
MLSKSLRNKALLRMSKLDAKRNRLFQPTALSAPPVGTCLNNVENKAKVARCIRQPSRHLCTLAALYK